MYLFLQSWVPQRTTAIKLPDNYDLSYPGNQPLLPCGVTSRQAS